MTNLWKTRVGFFCAALLCSLIELGVSGGLVGKLKSTTFLFDDGFDTVSGHLTVPTFANLALAVSVISLVVVGLLLAVDVLRAGALTSWVSVELGAVGLLWVLWLAAAADTANQLGGQTLDCSGSTGDLGTICNLYNATEAFAFINWLLLMFYFAILLSYSIIAYNRGHAGVWQSTVRDTDFGAQQDSGIPMTQAHPAV